MTGIQLADLRARAREIAQTVVRQNAAREDEEALWPEPALRALGDAGLWGLNAPRHAGGHEAGLSGLVAVSEELGRESGSVALCFAMHCVGTAVISAKATDRQRDEFLVPIARGEHLTTLALSEPGTGSHFYIPQTTLQRTAHGYRLDGTKSFVTNGGHADSYVLSTVAAPGTSGGEEGTFSAVIVEKDVAGMEWQEAWRGLGMRGNSSRSARLEGVEVDASRLLGEEGDQLWYIFEVVAPYFLMAMAGTYLGIAAGAVELARQHVAGRRHAHSGELLGAEPVVAHELGGMWIELQRARQHVYAAAAAADAGEAEALLGVLSCKVAASDAAVQLTNEAMTLGGGIAFRENSQLARLLRDARASHVMAPTTHMLRQWLGRALVGLPLL